jgi:hypothetical protein
LSNNELAKKIEDLNNAIKKRDQMAEEWNGTLESIDTKITTLEAENSELKKEKEYNLIEMERLKEVQKETESFKSLLQGKCDYMEKLTAQLESDNRLLEATRTVSILNKK